jgi:hypothetical protein
VSQIVPVPDLEVLQGKDSDDPRHETAIHDGDAHRRRGIAGSVGLRDVNQRVLNSQALPDYQ